MSRTEFLIVMVAFAALVLAAMWIGWRRRSRRDRGIAPAAPAPVGGLIAVFERASYVSTTAAGAPMERLAIPGLRFKGFARIDVHLDGVSIAVTGEDPVHIPADRVLGTGAAGRRVGKAVEREGLALLRWRASETDPRELESSFRFANPAEQLRFAEAIAEIRPSASTTDIPPTIQEDA